MLLTKKAKKAKTKRKQLEFPWLAGPRPGDSATMPASCVLEAGPRPAPRPTTSGSWPASFNSSRPGQGRAKAGLPAPSTGSQRCQAGLAGPRPGTRGQRRFPSNGYFCGGV